MFDNNLKINLKHKPAIPWQLIVLWVIFSAGAIVGGIWYYEYQKKELLTDSLKALSTISDLKIKQITQWRRERTSDGLFLSHNISIARNFSQYLHHPEDRKLRGYLINDLKSLSENYDYRNVIFVDKSCDVLLFYPNQDTIIGDYLMPKLPQFIRDGNVVLTDFHQTGKVSFVHLDLIVPLRLPGDTTVFGLLVLRIDPYKVLYPLIKSWPVASKTSEALLFRREGDEIVYLNDLRYAENAEMIQRRPVTMEKLPAAMALQGIRETTDGIDYRGVHVIAAMNKVPESMWYMVAKVDRAEVVETLKRQGSMVLIVVALILLTTDFFHRITMVEPACKVLPQQV